MAIAIALTSCGSPPVVSEQATADTVQVLTSLNGELDDGELTQLGPEFEAHVLRPLGKQAGQVINEALADGRIPDRGAVATELVTAAHGDAFPGLLRLFDTYSQSEAYPDWGEGPDESTGAFRRQIEYWVLAMGGLLAADEEAAAAVEQVVAGSDDSLGAYMAHIQSNPRNASHPPDRNPTDLHHQIDWLGDMIGTGIVTSPGGLHGWKP